MLQDPFIKAPFPLKFEPFQGINFPSFILYEFVPVLKYIAAVQSIIDPQALLFIILHIKVCKAILKLPYYNHK